MDSGQKNFLISIKFSSFFTAASGYHETRRHTDFAQFKRQISHPRVFSANRRGGDDSKTQIGLETEKKKEKVRKCADLREIFLPFFRQCIWGGGAPSAVQ